MMDDVIYRQQAIEGLYDVFFDDELSAAYPKEADKVLDVIRKLPTAQPERKKGKWKRRLVDGGFNADWYCSECGWRTSLEEHGYNFCPNCGADMRGESDES